MKSGFESIGRVRLQAILLLVLVLAIGFVLGVAVDRLRLGGMEGPSPRHEGPPPRGLPPELREGMNLSPDQETRIQAILDHSRPRTDAILDDCLPRLRAVADSIRLEIRAVLTPDQQRLFDEREPIMKGPGAGRVGDPEAGRAGPGPRAGADPGGAPPRPH